MTEKRFRISQGYNDRFCHDWEKNKLLNFRQTVDLLNELHDENQGLKKALLFFYDVANCECSTNWKGDMEKGCKRFFNCTYEEAEEKYGNYDGMWWELEE